MDGVLIDAENWQTLSQNAISGFYFFCEGSDFVQAAMKMVQKDASVDDNFYIAPVMNELVLENKNLELVKIPSSAYHNFYFPQKINENGNILPQRLEVKTG